MSETFNRPGAIDLSNLADQIQMQNSNSSTSGSFVTEITEANFQDVVAKSLKHPVLLLITTEKAAEAQQMTKDLTELAQTAAGKFLLGIVNVDNAMAIAQALQVQAIPTLVAIIGGQLAPLCQGIQPKEVLSQALDQIYKAAMANGVVGKAEPVTASDTAPEEVSDPRLEPAYQAMEAEDFAKAIAEFEKVLAENPNLSEAKAGKAQAELVLRTTSSEIDKIANLDSDSLEYLLAQADLALIAGNVTSAFDLVLDRFALADSTDREVLRCRLLEYFDIFGASDANVVKARRRLTTLLY